MIMPGCSLIVCLYVSALRAGAASSSVGGEDRGVGGEQDRRDADGARLAVVGCCLASACVIGGRQRFLVARGFNVDRALDMYSKWVACSERAGGLWRRRRRASAFIVAGRWRRGRSCRWTQCWKIRTPSRQVSRRSLAVESAQINEMLAPFENFGHVGCG